jgi:hypothetical protein
MFRREGTQPAMAGWPGGNAVYPRRNRQTRLPFAFDGFGRFDRGRLSLDEEDVGERSARLP